MAKAVTEVAIGAAAIAAAVFVPGAGMAAAAALIHLSAGALTGALVSMGASTVLAGVADALKGNQGGIAVGVATPIGPWAYIYGTQKVGGVEIFRESNNNTGVSGSTSNNKQLHRVYALDCHPSAIGSGFQLRIDGKQVLLASSGTDWVSYSPTQITHNIASISRTAGVVTMTLSGSMPPGTDGTTLQMRSVADRTFNGTFTVTQPNPSDPTTFTYVCGGPDATTSGGNARTTYSDYKDKIRVSFLDGNHTSSFPTLLAAGTTWTSSDLCLGRTLVYVQMGYDDTVFPSSIPNVSFVIQGKNDILDPRTGTRGWTNNAALCIADYLSLPPTQGGFGLAIGTDIPTAALIAAANLCDETLPLNTGGTVPQYTCDAVLQVNTPRGTNLKNLLSSCAGRLTYQGGQYFISPGAWVAPTLSLTDADLVGPVQWRPRFSVRDTCNAVKGTYVSPENAWQLADIPAYMQDAKHGFVSDPWLAEDNGERIFHELSFPCTTNSAVAQRLAKIALLRTRYQGRGTIRCSLKAYQATALDVIQISHASYGWVNKLFEVQEVRFGTDKTGEAPLPFVELDIAETDAAIYEWNAIEQLTPQGYRQPNNVGNRICMPPDDVSAYSGPGAVINGITYPSTVTTGADGRVQNSVYVRWDTPYDAAVFFGGHIEVQWQRVGDTTWTSAGKVDPATNYKFITGVSDGQQYVAQVRCVNVVGVPSDWIETNTVTVSNALSTGTYSGQTVAPPGTLGAQALSGGTAQITITNFTATTGTLSAAVTPSPSTLTGLGQGQVYWVYYVDPQFAGGTVTPVATQNDSDFLNHAGYFLIGQITTPTYSVRYQPTSYNDVGAQTTSSPAAAFDNNTTTDAVVLGRWWSVQTGTDPVTHLPIFAWYTADGDCVWSGFPAITTSAAMTLYIIALCDNSIGGGTFSAAIVAHVDGTDTTVATFSAAAAETTYTVTIPSGTNLANVSVEARVSATAPATPGGGAATIQGFEIYIQ